MPEGKSYLVQARIGYERTTNSTSLDVEFEPDVVDIEYFVATEGSALGVAALIELIHLARIENVHCGHMQIVNPRVVRTSGRLQATGEILQVFYCIDPNDTFHPKCPTATFHKQADLSTPEQALKYITYDNSHDQLTQPEESDIRTLECVIWF